jgi:hypothetical protein
MVRAKRARTAETPTQPSPHPKPAPKVARAVFLPDSVSARKVSAQIAQPLWPFWFEKRCERLVR